MAPLGRFCRYRPPTKVIPIQNVPTNNYQPSKIGNILSAHSTPLCYYSIMKMCGCERFKFLKIEIQIVKEYINDNIFIAKLLKLCCEKDSSKVGLSAWNMVHKIKANEYLNIDSNSKYISKLNAHIHSHFDQTIYVKYLLESKNYANPFIKSDGIKLAP